MRREWSAWIKARQWAEFEQLAKHDPSQPLADTVAELERGFPDKPDRKALRKVLFLLERAGYKPQAIESHEDAPVSVPAQPFETAFMLSADGSGDAYIIYAKQSGSRVRWLHASINPLTGVSQATEEETALDVAAAQIESLQAKDRRPNVGAVVDPAFVLGRLATAFLPGKPVPPVMAFWKAQIIGALQGPHPAEKLPRADTMPDERRMVALGLDASLLWRLELGMASPVLMELSELQREGIAEDLRKIRTEAILTEGRARLFTPEVILDHTTRLLDLAYILSVRNEDGVGLLVSTADDLRERGPESDYAKGLFDKTVVLLVETLRAPKGDKA